MYSKKVEHEGKEFQVETDGKKFDVKTGSATVCSGVIEGGDVRVDSGNESCKVIVKKALE